MNNETDIKEYTNNERINIIVSLISIANPYYMDAITNKNMDELLEFLKDIHGLSTSETIELIKVYQTLFRDKFPSAIPSKFIFEQE